MRPTDNQPPEFPDAWLAYGPEKQEWKEAGNYYSSSELRLLAASLGDLEIALVPPEEIHVE